MINKWVGFIIFLLIILTFVVIEINEMNHNSNPDAYDTSGYLGEAVYIKNSGGIINFPGMLISGQYKQANQHPLYILLLSVFASQDISFYINSKLITVLIGLILTILLYFIGKELYGELTAGIAATGLILNYVFIEWTSIISCESLFMLFSLLTFYFTAKGFYNNKFWLLAGIMAGFAFLSKGTGLFLLPGFLVSAFFVYRFSVLRNKYFYAFFILFLAIVSPLVIRNVTVYHNPIFNMNYYIVKYGYFRVDETMYQVFNPHEGAGLWKFDDKGYVDPTASEQIKALPVNSKYQKGLFKEINLFINDIELKLEQRFMWHWQHVIVSILMVLLFFIGLRREKNSGIKVYTLTTIITFIVGLSLVRPIPRYLLPIIPMFWLFCGYGFITVVETLDRNILSPRFGFRIFKFIPYALILFLMLNILYTFIKADLSNPLNSANDKSGRLELVNWLNEHLNSEEKYLLGPGVNWQINNGTFIFPPRNKLHDFKSLTAFAKKHDMHYMIIDKAYVASEDRYPEYKKNMDQYFKYYPVTGLKQVRRLENWDLAYSSNLKPVNFLIYKFTNDNNENSKRGGKNVSSN